MPAETSIPVSADALAHSQRVSAFLHERIREHGGWLAFSQWMHDVLYAPGLGYYAAGSEKLATVPETTDQAADRRASVQLTGDFVTAPQLTPLFGHTLATQVQEVLQQSGTDSVLEFGAGTGALAHSVLSALDARAQSVRYFILEVSADLQARQRQLLAPWAERVTWLEQMPAEFSGCVLANEVLDAMPVELFVWDEHADQVLQVGVLSDGPTFKFSARPAPTALEQAVRARMPYLPGYRSEINLQSEAWVRQLGGWLTKGAALLIDYGFPRHEYFHPQRHRGTLMCHIQHRAHDDVFLAPGLQDITAHVDFSAIAQAAHEVGLDILGYTSQARFLMNSGLPDLLTEWAQQSVGDVRAMAQTHGAVQKLMSEAEMGELFKVIALGRGLPQGLSGFERGDRTAQL